MFRLSMVQEIILSLSAKLTMITEIYFIFMFRLNMCLKMTLLCSLIITLILIIKILDTFMYRSIMCQHMFCCCKHFSTFRTLSSIYFLILIFIFRNLQLHLNSIRARDKSLAKNIMADIEFLQWASTSQETFHQNFELLEKKYENVEEPTLKVLVQAFFDYMREVWIESNEQHWYEASHPYASGNNQGIEGLNKEIKQSHTFRKLMPLGSFVETSIRLVHEMSLVDDSKLTKNRNEALFSHQNSLSLRTAGYSWFMMNKSDRDYVYLNATDLMVLMPGSEKIWGVKSSQTSTSSKSLRELAKDRILTRFDNSSFKNFDEMVETRSSCYIVEQRGNNFFCDCPLGIKGKLCKHSVGLLYKTKVLDITPDVRSVPLGQKRPRGRPKTAPKNCLARSPIRQANSQPELEPEPELQLELTEVVINLDDPVTMDLGPLADIPVVVDNAVGLSPLSTIKPKKRKRETNVATVRKSRRLLNKK